MTEQIHPAMLAVMRDVGIIAKDSVNQAQRFKFRGIDAVYNTLHGLMAKHGVYSTSEVLNTTREERVTPKGSVLAFVTITMQYRFYADDGSSVTTQVIGEAMDAGDKASNKAMAIAHKYALLQAFMVPTEDVLDPDLESHEIQEKTINTAQADQLIDGINASGIDMPKFCGYYGIADIGDLPADKFEHALAAIMKRVDAKRSAE